MVDKEKKEYIQKFTQLKFFLRLYLLDLNKTEEILSRENITKINRSIRDINEVEKIKAVWEDYRTALWDSDNLKLETFDLLKAEYKQQQNKKRTEEAKKIDKPMSVFTDKSYQANLFMQIQPIFYDKSGSWWLWDVDLKFWEIVDEVDILNMISSTANIDVISSKSRTEILNSLKQEGRKNIPKQAPSTWIQFKNGIVDINEDKPETLIEPSPEYFITNPIPHNLGDEIDTPTIDGIFIQWVGTEYKEILYEIIAYCLLPNYPLHRLFCFIGGGMNGKTSFMDFLRKFIGIKNCTSTELDTLMNSRFEITRLYKKLVCMMGETNFNELTRTSIIKKLTGNDLIGFEYKNKNPFHDKNYAKIIISTNNLPTTSDKTVGFYRRWLIIDFPNEFNEKEEVLSYIPDQEYENLALRSIFTLKKLLEKREFTNEGSIADKQRRYEEKSNPLDKFWKENIRENYGNFLPKYELRDFLDDWCVENKFRKLTDKTISKFMKEKEIDDGREYMEWFTAEGKKPQVRVWYNIKLKELGGKG